MAKASSIALVLFVACCTSLASATTHNFQSLGGIANDASYQTCLHNGQLLNKTFVSLSQGDVLLVPNTTFWLAGGIYASDLKDITIQIEGTFIFSDDQKTWPRHGNGPKADVLECFQFERINGLTFTSTGTGTINGNGMNWWGAIEYLEIGENRPRLVNIYNSTNILVEHILLKQSPYWTFWAHDIANLTIRYSAVDVRADDKPEHDWKNLQAFNTDGFDVTGRDVHIHDCTIWNDDDCIAVKGTDGNGHQSKCSENMLFERIQASGLGLTIGSIGPSTAHTCVRNITFRDCFMNNTYKGIYVKSRPGDSGTASISDVLFENVVMERPEQWAIWIGPQQAGYTGACSLLWPFVPGATCPVPTLVNISDITLRNVTISNSALSPGVLLGAASNPLRNITFDGVVAKGSSWEPFLGQYKCENVEGGVVSGGTSPKPSCF